MRSAVQELSGQVEAEHGLGLRMRIGIDTGEVVVTGLAGRAPGEALAVGDSMNRAARLQSAAAPGAVLLSVDTVRQVRELFGLCRVGGLQLTGIRPGRGLPAHAHLGRRRHPGARRPARRR